MNRKFQICSLMIGVLVMFGSVAGQAQTGPVSSISTQALVDALTPAPRPLTRGLSVTPRVATPPSIDLAVGFEFASSRLTVEAIELLTNLGEALQSPALASQRFRLSGHTDAVGSDAVNDRLSLERAEAVRTFLVNVFAVPPSRLEAVGYGRQRLLLPDAPDDESNRRVEVSVIVE
jgi:outer membrane protein OmpA-like peptidoglycan-associated protein